MESGSLKNPIFVTGPPRSGTTLIQLLVSAHSNIYTLPETHYFTFVKDIAGDQFGKEYVQSVLQSLSQKPGISFSEESKKQIDTCVENKGINDRNILHCIIEEFKEVNNLSGTRWLEKTPRHILRLDEIKKCWPDACFLVVIRDPRGAISSFHSKRNFSSKYARYMDLFRRIDAWKMCIKAKDSTKVEFKQICYESLVAKPKDTLGDIMAYVGEKTQNDQLQSFNNNFSTATLTTEGHKHLNNSSTIVDRTIVWTDRLSRSEIKWIEYLCLKEMRRLDYIPICTTAFPDRNILYYLLYRLRCALAPLKQWFIR